MDSLLVRRSQIMAACGKEEANVGDIVCLIGGKRVYFPYDTTENVTQYDIIGVVYAVDDNGDGTKTVRVVGDGNTETAQWSCVADYEITAIPSASGSYAVTLNGVAQGSFTYTRAEGTIKEFCEQLEAWLRSCSSSSKAAKWEAYYDDEKQKGFLQMWKYDEYESTVTIASTTLTKLIGSELASYTSSAMYNTIGQSATYCGMSRDRLEQYCKTNTSSNCNPKTAMNGTTQLFVTFPCSETYYNSDLGVNLRAHYATYSLYLDACMIDIECNKGILANRDGKLMTGLLADKTVKKQGVTTKAYPAAQKALAYTKGVEGFGVGKWWLPSMYELAKLMRDIKENKTDIVNVSLGKCGYSKISSTSNRWSCCRCHTSRAWYCYNVGLSSDYYVFNSFCCSVVSDFKIKS